MATPSRSKKAREEKRRVAKPEGGAKGGPERRKHARAVASFPCVLIGPDKKEEHFDLVDLSESGVRMRCGRALPAMTQIEVALVLPKGRVGRPKDAPLSTRGVVVWSHAAPKKSAKAGRKAEFDTGVFFPELSTEQRGLLAAYVLTAAS
jgi:hypothetical protein